MEAKIMESLNYRKRNYWKTELQNDKVTESGNHRITERLIMERWNYINSEVEKDGILERQKDGIMKRKIYIKM